MAYIGNVPSVNFTSFAKQDITGDGTPNYTLTYAVANANEIEVFVNNVRQEPTSAYTVSGTALTMTGNVASTDDFYVIYLGKALQTTTPPDGSVSTAKIADDAVTSAKISYPLTTFSSTGIDDNATSTAMTLDSSGNLLVGKTAQGSATVGGEILASGTVIATRSGSTAGRFNRTTSDGSIVDFRKDNSILGQIEVSTSGSGQDVFLGNQARGLKFRDTSVIPRAVSDGSADNVMDLGSSASRFDDIYATNGTIQTSDQNEKNTITDSDLGIDFIKRLTPKSYIFNGKTRTHYGLIAQDVETVLTDINKPTSGFAGFIKTDISEEQDGSEYRYGLRYTEFVAPLIQAVKDQQTIIEDLQARITALENS